MLKQCASIYNYLVCSRRWRRRWEMPGMSKFKQIRGLPASWFVNEFQEWWDIPWTTPKFNEEEAELHFYQILCGFSHYFWQTKDKWVYIAKEFKIASSVGSMCYSMKPSLSWIIYAKRIIIRPIRRFRVMKEEKAKLRLEWLMGVRETANT